MVCVHTAGPCSFHPQNSVALDATFKTEGQVEMLKSLKLAFTQDTVSSIEPRVILPAWKSVIVDCLTIFTLGLCRWRWNGVTVKEFGDGFTSVEFICDKSVHSDPEAMKLVHEAAEEFGASVVKVDKLPPHLLPSGSSSYSSARATDRILSGLLSRPPLPPIRPMMPLPANGGSVIHPTEQRPQDAGFIDSMVLGYALNDGITGGILGGNISGGIIGDALNTSENDADSFDCGSFDDGE